MEWDLSELLDGKDDAAYIDELTMLVDEFVSLKDALNTRLLDAIILKERIAVLASRISAYYYLTYSENTHESGILAKMTRYEQISTELDNRMLFFTQHMKTLDDEEFTRIITDPAYAEYSHYLSRIRAYKDHILDEPIERIINLKNASSGALADIYTVLKNGFSYTLDDKDVTEEELRSHITGHDPKKREQAYAELQRAYAQNSTVLTEIYKAIVIDWRNEDILIRKYPEPISPRNLSNDVSDAAVDALLESVKRNATLFQEYFLLKHTLNAQAYPYSRIHLYAPYTNVPEKTYTLQESIAIVRELYAFNETFSRAAEEILDSNHIHAYPRKHKKGGAYCYTVAKDITPYILLNHTGTLKDLFTLAHEMGHGIHSILARDRKELVHHAGLPLAETASIFSELLLTHHLLKDADREQRIAILIDMLDGMYASIHRQAYFAIFERYAHDAIPQGATKEQIQETYMALLKEQFGEMELPDAFKHEWNSIPHIHETPFYVYAYAWGNLLVCSLYEQYEQDPAFIENIIRLLSYGGSVNPIKALKEIGMDPEDVAFWNSGFRLIRTAIDELRTATDP